MGETGEGIENTYRDDRQVLQRVAESLYCTNETNSTVC